MSQVMAVYVRESSVSAECMVTRGNGPYGRSDNIEVYRSGMSLVLEIMD